jgi:Family of unknown function (DUF6459)
MSPGWFLITNSLNQQEGHGIPRPEMSPPASTTHRMQQIPPPQLPWHDLELPARPTDIPMLPTRVEQPGRQAPLPDAVAVRQCPVPATAPPFDTDVPPDTRHGTRAVTAASSPPPDLAAAVPAPATPDNGTSDISDSDADETGRAQPGPAGGWPSQFAQVLAETLAGSRPARQLAPWTTEQARKRIQQLGPMFATDQRPKVRRVMTSAPAPNVLEVTAVVGFGPRIRVLALRLEREQVRAYREGGSRWCCTAIESA